MQIARAIGDGWVERKRVGNGQLPGIPRAIRGSACPSAGRGAVAGRSTQAIRVHVEVAGELVSVVHGGFVVTVFVSNRVQKDHRVGPEIHCLIAQSVGEAKTWTKVVPMGIGTTVSGTTRTIPEQIGGAQQRLPSAGADRPGIGPRRIKENDLVGGLATDSHSGEWPFDVPAKPDSYCQLGVDLNVVLNIRRNIKVTELGFQRKM